MRLRRQRIATALKKQISNILQYELKDARLGFVTVMRVDLTADLRFAKVYFSVFGDENQQKATQQALESAKSFIRYLVGERIKLRFVPEIGFKLDHSPEYSIRIQEKIDELKQKDEHKKHY